MVREAEAQIAADASLNHEYLPVPGMLAYTTAATRLLLGADSPAIAEGRVSANCIFLFLMKSNLFNFKGMTLGVLYIQSDF